MSGLDKGFLTPPPILAQYQRGTGPHLLRYLIRYRTSFLPRPIPANTGTRREKESEAMPERIEDVAAAAVVDVTLS